METGVVNVGDKVLICPNKEHAIAKSIVIDDNAKVVAFAGDLTAVNIDFSILKWVGFSGDQATITLSGIEIQNVSIGNVLCDPHQPVPVSNKFEARIVVFNIAIPITKGYSVSLT